jgi:hypothetical protein
MQRMAKMKYTLLMASFSLALSAGMSFAQSTYTPDQLLDIARASGVCGEKDVVSASLRADGLNIDAVCSEEPVAFFGPAAAAGGLALLAAFAGGGGSVSTTSGT